MNRTKKGMLLLFFIQNVCALGFFKLSNEGRLLCLQIPASLLFPQNLRKPYKMSLRLRNLNPYELHKSLVNQYFLKKPGDTRLLERDTSKDKTDSDVIRLNHRFLWDEEASTWEEKLAKKYFDKLFKEYTISDLSRYKENKVCGLDPFFLKILSESFISDCPPVAHRKGSHLGKGSIHVWEQSVRGKRGTSNVGGEFRLRGEGREEEFPREAEIVPCVLGKVELQDEEARSEKIDEEEKAIKTERRDK